ncbi:MAG: ribosome biosis GTPase / thiamine phosphate phosphatase [Candidatus Sumerlaeota bacterium]|nr:ribosome biosis GTPase / thiamine phosphate phosphatase [Candidatus Sumerlaeota bacterium]
MNENDASRHDSLKAFGWDDARAREFAQLDFGKDALPGRVVIRHKGMYTLRTPHGEVFARIKGYLRYKAGTRAELPVVGDWVAIAKKPHEEMWRIQAVLERRTQLRRKVQGKRAVPQVIAANVTTVVVVMGLTEDFNLRRLERYMVLVHESGARPFIVLNKADLLDEEWLEASLDEVGAIVGDAETVTVSALDEDSARAALAPLLAEGETLVFVGSSGAGKSTLINAILGEERFRTGAVRASDGKGRHTTTVREMVLTPQGAVVIDSPGIRELQLLDMDEGLGEAFADIEELAAQCRFRDCTHTSEPGCAIADAIENEELDEERFASYLKLHEESEHNTSRRKNQIEEQRKAFREIQKTRRREGRE